MSVLCPYCNREFNQITIQHLRKHNKDLQDLKIEFPNCRILSEYSKNKMINTQKETCLERYGIESTNSLQNIKEKKVRTFIENYGVDNPSKVKEILDKKEETWIKKYGVKNPSQSKEIKDKKKKTIVSNGYIRSDEELTEKELYKRKVSQFTDITIRKKFKKDDLKKRGKCGIYGAKQVDHIYSINDGFINNIPPEILCHECNIRLIDWEDNTNKWKKSDITINELYSLIEEYENRKENDNGKKF